MEDYILDIIVTSVYLVLLIVGAYKLREVFVRPNTVLYKWIIPAFIVKLIAAILFLILHELFLPFGDTFGYLLGADTLLETLYKDPLAGIQLFFSSAGSYHPNTYQYANFAYYWEESTYVIVRLASVCKLLSFGSNYGTSMLFATICFSGNIALYKVFSHVIPDAKGKIAFATFFIPSLVFWGSGIIKDPVTFCAVCWIMWSTYYGLILGRYRLVSLIILVPSLIIIALVKGYILAILLPCLILWVVLKKVPKIRDKSLRVASVPVLGITAILIVGAGVYGIGKVSKFKLRQFVQLAAAYQGWHSSKTNPSNNSAYSIEFEPNFLGIAKAVPASINVTLFRPYFNEIVSAPMLMNGVESFLLLLFTIFIVIRVGPLHIITNSFKDEDVLFCLLFSFGFAFVVGFTTFNFGSLVRYKIPCMPFYLIALLILWHKRKTAKPWFNLPQFKIR